MILETIIIAIAIGMTLLMATYLTAALAASVLGKTNCFKCLFS